MAATTTSCTIFILLSLAFLLHLNCSLATQNPRKLALVQQEPLVLKYHHGPLLKGTHTVNLLFYGTFTPAQRSIVSDFIRSLSPASGAAILSPSVASWWSTTARYGGAPVRITLGRQLNDVSYSKGKFLKSAHLTALAAKATHGQTNINVVITSADVAVDGFCLSRCGTHGRLPGSAGFIWVGNSMTQCAGQCAWPFHQPIYGPQTPPLGAPNGDVGIDGVIINLSTLLAGLVTNPYGNGYFQGPANAPLEAVSACTGLFGSGAYPGYPGKVLVEPSSGASYNAKGLDGRKYLLPAMWDPKTSQCSTLV